MDEDFAREVLAIVAEIPPGRVATYGQIARLAGKEKCARQVGHILKNSERFGDYPCHRVVNASGRLVPGWEAQRWRLHREGVDLKNENGVDLKLYGWKP